MTGLFILASDLGPSGAAKTLALTVPTLASRSRVAVGVLDRSGGPFDAALDAARCPPVPLTIRGSLGLGGLGEARRQVGAFRPDVMLAVGPAAVRLAPLLSRPGNDKRKPCPIIASAASHPGGGLRGWWARKMLRRADAIVATTRAEADRYVQLGIPADRVELIPPGVRPTPPPPDPVAFRKALDIPAGARLVIAAGGFDAAAGLRSAVWAFDVIKYVAPDVYLVLVGDGPGRDRAERFARDLGFDDYRVRFTGVRSDVPALLGLAEVVWVTHTHGGVNLALEAMAAGRPVVALRTPDIAEVVEDGETGRLVPPADRVGLAAATRELLADPGLAGRLGAAGKAQVAERHSLTGMTDRYAVLYERTAGG
ncbi:MAG TPA: glycosyltransferase [Fimbriiglobus sp.]|nr:glycosyltransferase [Fimbriiglobus sp.]